MDKKRSCRYCGIIAHGPGCAYSHNGLHVETGDSEHCIYCGSTAYNVGCPYSQEDGNVHKHGHGDGKCVWCGMKTRSLLGCPVSHNGKHEF